MRHPGQGRQHDPARLSLPPGIHDRATLPPDGAPVPHPGFGVDGLPHATQEPQAAEVMPLNVLVAPLHERPDGRGCGVENAHLVLGANLPKATLMRSIGCPLIHDLSGAVSHGSIDDVAVPCDPANVCGTPEHVVVFQVEHVARAQIGTHHVSARAVHDALGLARGSGGVEKEQNVLGLHRLGCALLGGTLHGLVEPHVPALRPNDFILGATHGQHRVHFWPALQGKVHLALERQDLPAPPGSIGGDHRLTLAVVDAISQRLGAESTKDHGVDGPQPGTGQNGHGQLGDHGHVDGHTVALGHAPIPQDVGQPADIPVQLSVGQAAGVSGLTFPK